MPWLIDLAFILAGLTALYFGAEWLVGGSSRLALRLGISPLVVGLTVVAFGTSAPELFVSLQLTLEGQPDMAVGNVVGSNICNLALVLGASALASRLVIKSELFRRDLPALLLGTGVFIWMLLNDQHISRLEGGVLFVGIVVYTIHCLRKSRSEKNPEVLQEFEAELDVDEAKKDRVAWLLFLVFIGLVGLYFGAEWMKKGGISLAQRFGISEAVISLTIIAFATSVPELATSVVASMKKEGDIITGNVIGSCLFNLLSVIGITALVQPMTIREIEVTDLSVMAGLTVVVVPMMFLGRSLGRLEGALLLASYFGYVYALWLRIQGAA